MILSQEGLLMKSAVLLISLLFGCVTQAAAADAPIWRYSRHSDQPAFLPSERAQSIRASGACWSECGSYTTWNLVACLEHDAQGRCLKRTDWGDRMCQRACRTSGGPWVPDIFDF
jgi:hypothetical protein